MLQRSSLVPFGRSCVVVHRDLWGLALTPSCARFCLRTAGPSCRARGHLKAAWICKRDDNWKIVGLGR